MHHWYKAVKHPLVHFDEVFRVLIQESYDIFMEIITELVLSPEIQDMASRQGAKVMTLPCLSPSQSPLDFVEKTLSDLASIEDVD